MPRASPPRGRDARAVPAYLIRRYIHMGDKAKGKGKQLKKPKTATKDKK
jgi:hypothetical protein